MAIVAKILSKNELKLNLLSLGFNNSCFMLKIRPGVKCKVFLACFPSTNIKGLK